MVLSADHTQKKGDTMKSLLAVGLVAAAALTAACGGQPGEQGLRDSFAQQLGANKFVKEFQRNLNEMTFVGPGPEGGTAKWRVQIDSALRRELWKDFFVALTLYNTFDSRPPNPDAERNDLGAVVSLGWSY